MQYHSIVVGLATLPAILAIPHNHHHHGSSIVASAASAPYGQSNVTLGATGTGTGVAHYSTVILQSTRFHTIAASSSSSSPSEAATEAGGSGADACGSAVTVTVNPSAVITVTVTGNGSPAQSGVESSAPVVASSPATVVSAPVVASSSAPVVSVSAKPQTSATVVSSVMPSVSVTQSPGSSSAGGASNVAPVQTYSASAATSVAPPQSSSVAPVESVASSASATPSATVPVPASGVASADYCKNTFKIEDNQLLDADTNQPFQYTGANYTGGVKGKKRGIVFVAAIPEQSALVDYANANPSIKWLGNYFSAPPADYGDMKFEFVPQMYGRQSIGQEWTTNAKRAIDAGVKYFLSFGEAGTPNDKNYQTASDSAQTFIDQMQPSTKNGVTIGAPGSLGGPQDLKWEQDFLCSCQGKGCSIGFQTGHWFDAAAPLDQQVARAKGTIEAYIAVAKGKPVWFENIWAKGTAAEQKAFMDVLVPWLEDNTAIERYGWVPMDDRPADGDPFTSGGSATDLANHFAQL